MLALHTAIIIAVILVAIAIPVAAIVLLVIFLTRRSRRPAQEAGQPGEHDLE